MQATAIDKRGVRIDDTARVDDWIREQLTGVGFTEDDATVVIAARLDWRTLVQLRERGCDRQLALAIVR
jgi:hypothetical protein